MKFRFQLLISEKMTENLTGVHTAVSLLRVKSRELAMKKSAWLCLTVLAAGSPDEELLLWPTAQVTLHNGVAIHL